MAGKSCRPARSPGCAKRQASTTSKTYSCSTSKPHRPPYELERYPSSLHPRTDDAASRAADGDHGCCPSGSHDAPDAIRTEVFERPEGAHIRGRDIPFHDYRPACGADSKSDCGRASFAGYRTK